MLLNVLLMIFGFGLVIAIHELGHFLAAKWAGVRVHAFAVGFGQAICSWRKGMGFRLGSSEREYKKLLAREREGLNPIDANAVSPTEYRLNWFPFGGYVKMLGQEDIDPSAVSTAPDSYNNKPVWKRMVIISAGVVMNIILAAVLFVAVFLAGGLYKPAPVIGGVMPGSPAQKAGLEPGDIIRTIDNRNAEVFEDLMIAAAMGQRGRELALGVERDGEHLTIRATPARDEIFGGLQGLGVVPGNANRLMDWDKNAENRRLQRARLDRLGLEGVEPSMRVVAVNGREIKEIAFALRSSVGLFEPIEREASASRGQPITLTFKDDHGTQVQRSVNPRAELESATTNIDGVEREFDHLLGLTPVMRVSETQTRGFKQGLRAGDVFAQLGDAPWPSIPEGMALIKRAAGEELPIVVVRDSAFVSMRVRVSPEGTIGFLVGEARDRPVLARTPEPAAKASGDARPVLAASRLTPGVIPGLVVRSVQGVGVDDFTSMRTALQHATRDALHAEQGATITITTALMSNDDPARTGDPNTQTWELTNEDVRALHALGWTSGELAGLFQTAQIEMKASGPVQALAMGVRATKRVLSMTYITFARLFQGTVKVEHLKGPVGITQIGSQMANEGFVYLLYFLALVSANLAVVNFLPIPIADGGHFVMLAYEGVTKKPVPMGVQNALTMLGLILIGAVFVIVTMNDIRGLF